jgi:hypothetical protein
LVAHEFHTEKTIETNLKRNHDHSRDSWVFWAFQVTPMRTDPCLVQ